MHIIKQFLLSLTLFESKIVIILRGTRRREVTISYSVMQASSTPTGFHVPMIGRMGSVMNLTD